MDGTHTSSDLCGKLPSCAFYFYTDRLKNINEAFKNFIKTKQSKYLHPEGPKQKQNPKQDWAKCFLLHFLCGLTVTLVKGEAALTGTV